MQVTIVTPENVDFNFDAVGPVERGAAWFVDMACAAALTAIASRFALLLEPIDPGLARAVALVAGLAVYLGYFIVQEIVYGGRSWGKRLVGLRVLDRYGFREQPWQAVVRNFLRVVDMMPMVLGLVGFLFAALGRYHQRLGDLAAGTIVVRDEIPRVPRALARYRPSRSESTSLAARNLRGRIGVEERALLLELLARRDRLQGRARGALFAQMAEHLRRKARVEPEPGLSDERFVCDLAVILLGGQIQARERSP